MLSLDDFKATWQDFRTSILHQLDQTKNKQEKNELYELISVEAEQKYMEYAQLASK